MASYPRDQAVRVLTRVLSDREPLDEAMASLSGEISAGSRGWLQEVCSGTLRWKGRLDLAIDSTALKKKPSGWLRKMLLVGAYQLIVQERTQPGAVVSETVSAIKRKEGEAPAKFANACLRKIADHAIQWRTMAPPSDTKDLAIWASLPEWFWNKLMFQRGREWAISFAQACLERPVLWVRARENAMKPEWAEIGPIPGSYLATVGGAVTAKIGFAEGSFFVQDISSQILVSEVSAEIRKHGVAHPAALDLCAAPGGKSVGMAWSGFQVVATDRDEKRLGLLRQTVTRVAPEIRVIPRGEVKALPEQDLVWVDAPCTGTGIIRRHPEVRWLRGEGELKNLGKLQRELISEAWEKVKAGGHLAYSVCSVLREEGADVVKDLVNKPGFRGHQIKEWLLVPQDSPHGDGFWAALLKKV